MGAAHAFLVGVDCKVQWTLRGRRELTTGVVFASLEFMFFVEGVSDDFGGDG